MVIHSVQDTAVRAGDDLRCGQCSDYLTIIETAYGHRATCRGCRIRWTLIGDDPRWTPEHDPLT